MRNQEPPFAIQVEPVEGCSLACSFCAISSIRHNGASAALGVDGKNSAPYKFMEHGTLSNLVRQVKRLGWNPRWEFAMHGEPSMHPQLPELANIVRTFLPKAFILVTSNGSGLFTGKRFEHLMLAGVNTLALDQYDHAPDWVDRVLEANAAMQVPYPVHRYPRDIKHSPHTRHSGQKVVVIQDISRNDTGTHQLTNQGGNNSHTLLTEPLKAKCAKPFRELSVRWDGNVALCCDDWPGDYKIENVNELSLESIWNHPRFDAARRRLYHFDRDFGPCKGCDVTSKRVGLLPDKFGKLSMPVPNRQSEFHLRQALQGKVFSLKVVP